MTEERTGAGAFWSYAHDDDTADSGGILSLAASVSSEYELIAGRPLLIFIDRKSLRWGDAWKERVDSALATTTFFIPVLTPRYFTRPECRRELQTFADQAQALGRTEWLLPILYVDVPELAGTSDPLIALVTRFHYSDWTSLRLADRSSAGFRQGVHSLAQHLVRTAAAIPDRAIPIPGLTKGMAETIERINALLPAWSEAVEDGIVIHAQLQATADALTERERRLRRSNAAYGAILSAYQRYANHSHSLAELYLTTASTYAETSAKLEPLVLAAVDYAQRDPAFVGLLLPLREAVESTYDNLERRRRMEEAEPHWELASSFAQRHIDKSSALQSLASIYLDAERLVVEANERVYRWQSALNKITPP